MVRTSWLESAGAHNAANPLRGVCVGAACRSLSQLILPSRGMELLASMPYRLGEGVTGDFDLLVVCGR